MLTQSDLLLCAHLPVHSLFLDGSGTIKLGGLGKSAQLGMSSGEQQLSICGTPEYAPSEELAACSNQDNGPDSRQDSMAASAAASKDGRPGGGQEVDIWCVAAVQTGW